jgi:hypothetical protein
LTIGQAVLALCGIRRWSWLSPAAGLAVLCALCWATVRLPGDGAISAGLAALATAGAVGFLRSRVEGVGEALRAGAPVALSALVVASLPFIVEGHYGILGTGFNPDMSQHLLATDRLADGAGGQLLDEGYPLGPHAVVAALEKGLAVGLVQGFSGLTVAVAILASLTALTAFAAQPPFRRTAAALLVGLPYLVASFFAQGSFKEIMQALLVLGFALALREASRNSAWRDLPLRYVPAAVIAIGSAYAYSFPGLIWLAGIAGLWAAMEFAWAKDAAPARLRAVSLAGVVLLVGALPELGRMIDFQRFETFDPNGPGLGNLFGQASPFTALGVWFSGDFRVAPGDGAVPAVAYYLGAALATALLIAGSLRSARGREAAILAAVLTVALVYLAARVGGTPYTAAKALCIAAPVLTLAILLPGSGPPSPSARRRAGAMRLPAMAAGAYVLLAGGCSLLAFANAPVGPTAYTSALAELRPGLSSGSTLVLASDELLDEQHGERYLLWELRGGRVCVERESQAGGLLPPGIRWVVVDEPPTPPYADVHLYRDVRPWAIWEADRRLRGPGPCPLVAVRQARQGPEP